MDSSIIESSQELEEGELSNDSDNYTPLKRPENYSNIILNKDRFGSSVEPHIESEDEVSSASECDSDSSGAQISKSKKPKIKPKPKEQRKLQLNKKYSIWSTRVQEDVLAETLDNCDVTIKDRSRAVESYDYTLSSKYHDINRQDSNKRTRADRLNVHLRLGKPRGCAESKQKGKPRKIDDLATTVEHSVEEIATDIANKLFEEKEDLILKVLNIAGRQKCFEKFKETQKIEADGGMLIMNQTRKRTPGGVFLYLIRCDDDISREQKNEMFNEQRNNNRKEKKKKKIQQVKKEIAMERAKLLPQLLTRTEQLLETEKVVTSDTEVINPPPTPEEASTLENDNSANSMPTQSETNGRNQLTSYDDDFLDFGCSNNDMDLF